MNQIKFRIIFLFCFVQLFSIVYGQKDRDLTLFVNPFIGTGGHGHTYPGATVPFGMVQLSPDTRLTGWDGCSGYHYTDSVIYGFSHTHLNGTGIPDYCDVLFMPTTGKQSINNTEYSSSFNHKNEIASPGYYSVFLDKYKIKAELTATKRAGLHKYTFPENDSSNIVIDLLHRGGVIESKIEITNNTEIRGMRRTKEWAEDQVIYFVARFSKPFSSYIVFANDTKTSLNKTEGKNIKAIVRFATGMNEEIFIKVGISAVSLEGAIKNLTAEVPDWEFGGILKQAKSDWNEELGKILIEGGTKNQQVCFYTALYHTMINPNLYMDVDGLYRGTDKKIHKAMGFDYYTIFSLWDTFRAEHPLLTIIDKKRTLDFIKTFLDQYKNNSLLPVWELASNETFCMIGYHSIPVITDAYIKGINQFDKNLALKAMKNSAEDNRFGLKDLKKYGFIPGDMEPESVSKTLEYGYDDWCIAQFANKTGNKIEYQKYLKRAQAYKNMFDPSTRHMRARTNGGWYVPFDPKEVNFNYTEGNSWQYSFFAQQDISGLAYLFGGKDKMAAKLDELFSTSSKTTGREQSDITGLIGQYAHGNEPSQHMAYLYNYLNQPFKTQQMVRRIQNEFYFNAPEGLCGNDDCGQMSAWYVLSSMGFYQVCPGNTQYSISSPMFDKVTINLENQKKFVISTKNQSKENQFIQSALMNGETYSRCYFTHDELLKGGTLEFAMGPEPNKLWGSSDKDVPSTTINEYPIITAPTINAPSKVFKNKLLIEMNSLNENSKIYYTTDGKDPDSTSTLYKKPFYLTETSTIKAYSGVQGTGKSAIIFAAFLKLDSLRTVKTNSKFSNQYTAGGPDGLIDGIRGGENFRTGAWQGYEGQDFEAIVDLGRLQQVNRIRCGFLQDIGSWIWMPVSVEFSVSPDGNNFQAIGTKNSGVRTTDTKSTIRDIGISADIHCRYVKVRAINLGVIPEWHPGAGGKPWIFIDEIVVD